jgi:hypothetical protein
MSWLPWRKKEATPSKEKPASQPQGAAPPHAASAPELRVSKLLNYMRRDPSRVAHPAAPPTQPAPAVATAAAAAEGQERQRESVPQQATPVAPPARMKTQLARALGGGDDIDDITQYLDLDDAGASDSGKANKENCADALVLRFKTALSSGEKTLVLPALVPLYIGRAAGCLVCPLSDPLVSQMHATINGLVLEDLNSTNGNLCFITCAQRTHATVLLKEHSSTDGASSATSCREATRWFAEPRPSEPLVRNLCKRSLVLMRSVAIGRAEAAQAQPPVRYDTGTLKLTPVAHASGPPGGRARPPPRPPVTRRPSTSEIQPASLDEALLPPFMEHPRRPVEAAQHLQTQAQPQARPAEPARPSRSPTLPRSQTQPGLSAPALPPRPQAPQAESVAELSSQV